MEDAANIAATKQSFLASCRHGGPPVQRSKPPPSDIIALAKSIVGSSELFDSAVSTTTFLHGHPNIKLHAQEADTTLKHLFLEFSCRDAYGLKPLNSRLKGASGARFAVDIGANLGDFTLAAYGRDPSLTILALEPMPITYLYFRWNLHANNIPIISEEAFANGKRGGVLPINAATTSDGRNVTIEFNPKVSGMSRSSASVARDLALRPVGAFADPSKVQRLHRGSLDLVRWLERHRVPSIDFLKMDCEGCEHELIPTLSASGYLNRTRNFEGEIHRCNRGSQCQFSNYHVRESMRHLCGTFRTSSVSKTLHTKPQHSSQMSCGWNASGSYVVDWRVGAVS